MIGRDRLYNPDEVTDELVELRRDRVRFEDLSAYYPTAPTSSPRGDGRPAAPASAPAARGAAAIGGSPAVTVLALVALSLFLLHRS